MDHKTDFSSDIGLLLDDLDVILKRLSLSLNRAHRSLNTSHMEDDALAGLRVMLVDDNTARPFLTSTMLKKFNYEDSPREKQKSTSRAAVLASSDYNQEKSRVNASRKRKPSREQPGDGKKTRARSPAPKKRRVSWTVELHNHFLNAIEALGVDKGVPKKILEYMRIPGLTRENVASHLQKYRIFVKKLVEKNPYIEPSTVKSLASRAFHSNFATDEPPAGNANQEGSITVSPAQSILNMSMGGGRSGRGIMQLVHQQNQMRWRKNIHTTGPLNTSTRTVFEKQKDNALVANMGTTANTSSSSIGNSAQPSTLSSTNFTGIQIINDNTNSRGTLHDGTIVSNMPTSSVMEVPSMIPELVGFQSAIEEPNSNLDYMNNEPSLVAPKEMSNLIPQPSDEVYFRDGIIVNENHEFIVPRHETRIPTTVPVAITPFAQEAQQPEKDGEDEEYPFEGLYDLIWNDTNLGISLHPLMNNYLNIEPSSVAPIEISNEVHKPSFTNTNGITTLRDEASFAGGIISDANHESIAQQQQTQVPTTVPVAPAPLVQEAQHLEQAWEDEEYPFEGLYDLLRNDSNLGNSFYPLIYNEDFEPFIQDFEISNTDKGGAMYGGEDFFSQA